MNRFFQTTKSVNSILLKVVARSVFIPTEVTTCMRASAPLKAFFVLHTSSQEGPSFFSRNLYYLSSSQYAQTYFGLCLYLLLAAGLCSLLAVLAYLLSLSTAQDTEKRSEYECGFAPFDSATRLPFDVHFYLVGILFLIFDVEVALLFPWVLGLRTFGWFGFYLMMGFIFVLALGFLYEWKRGALIWPNRQRNALMNKLND